MAEPVIICVSDIVEANGKTIRENNLERVHKFALGDVVDVDIEVYDKGVERETEVHLTGKGRLYVVAHLRDCDLTAER